MEFKTPLALLLIPIVVFVWIYLRRTKQDGGISFSSVQAVGQIQSTWKVRFNFILPTLRLGAIILLCVAMAGPRSVLEETRINTNGIDIVLALDCSGSMAAEDFKLEGKRANRFEIIRKVVDEFIQMRTQDQLGLVAFSGRAYTVCPLTTDRNWLLSNLARLRLGIIEDGTAIGSGIASSLSRFKDSKAKSKVIILLTDGVNNAGSMDPLTAAKTASAMGIKIYTIGAGAKGFAPFPVQDMFGRTFYQNVQIDLDEDTLKKIADQTNAKYFRATDTESLRDIYKSIDSLEKSKIEQKGYKQYTELFWIFVCAAMILVGIELVLVNSIFMKIP